MVDKLRIGKFKITGRLLRDLRCRGDLSGLKHLFSRGIIIVNCENRLWEDCLVYTGIWDRFESVGENCVPPSYEIVFKTLFDKEGKRRRIRISKVERLNYDY